MRINQFNRIHSLFEKDIINTNHPIDAPWSLNNNKGRNNQGGFYSSVLTRL